MTQGPITQIIIAIIVFGLVVGVFSGMYVTWGNNYHITPDTTMAPTYNKLNESNKLITDMNNQLQSSSVTAGSTSFSGLTGAALALKLTTNIVPYVNSMLQAAIIAIGIPVEFAGAFLAIILVIIVTTIIVIWMRNPI